MSIIKGLRAATARSPTVSKTVTVGSLTASGGLAIGEDPQSAARKLSAVDRCIEILSDSIAKLPNYVIDTRTRERTDHELLRLLNIRPNEAMTPFVRKKVLETSRLEGGNGYDWIVRDERTGKPVELIPVPWYLVQPWHDMAGRVWYDVTHPFSGEVMRLPNEDVCHYKNATRNGLLGLGTVTRAGEVIAAARAAQEYELSYYANGGQPGGVLETDTDLGGYVMDEHGKPLKRSDGSVFPAITAATAAAANTALIVPPSSDAISGPTSTTRSLLTAFARFTICATVSSEPPMTAMRSRLAAEASSAAVLRSRCTLCAALSHTITPTSSSSESAANALA